MPRGPHDPSEADRLFDVIPAPTVTVGMTASNDSLVLRANRAFGRLLGLEPDTVRGESFCELLDPDQRVGAQSVLLRLIAGALPRYDGEARLVQADGELLRVPVTACVVREGLSDEPAVWVQVTGRSDLSPDRSRQSGLGAREVQELARLGAFQWLPALDAVLISDEVFRLFDLEPGSLPGTLTAWEPRLHPGDLAKLLDEFTGAIMDSGPRRFEFRFRPRSGSWRWAEGRLQTEVVDGQPVRLLGTMQDIHERKLTEQQLVQELEELEAAAGLREAIADGRLILHAQTIVDVKTRKPRMAELLVRLSDRSGNVVAPSEFLCLAERHGVIQEIDRWVLGQAVELAAAGSPVTLNISAHTIGDPAYADAVIRLVKDHAINPTLITFELTETALVENIGVARRFAQRLELLGCRLALDDFGTGYGAMTYLKELSAHYLKIDREFVADATVNPRSRAVINGIVNLAESFGQQTIAEGVEDEATLALLAELGVEFAQGFHLGRPQPVDQQPTPQRWTPQAAG